MRKCQKFVKSSCRPMFSQRNKTLQNIPLCNVLPQYGSQNNCNDNFMHGKLHIHGQPAMGKNMRQLHAQCELGRYYSCDFITKNFSLFGTQHSVRNLLLQLWCFHVSSCLKNEKSINVKKRTRKQPVKNSDRDRQESQKKMRWWW